MEAPSHKYSWKQSFYDDRLQDFWVHQGNPVKEISDACKAPRVQGVGWWSPGWRVDLLAGLTRLLPGTCRAAVWVKAVCPELALRRKGAHALFCRLHVGAEMSQPPSVMPGHVCGGSTVACEACGGKVGSSCKLWHPDSTHQWLTRFKYFKILNLPLL